jgi:Leucine Rich repeat
LHFKKETTLQANRKLKQLYLQGCGIGDEGLPLIADALVGNTAIDALDISCSRILTISLVGSNLTRLDSKAWPLDTTTVHVFTMITFWPNEQARQRFAATIQENVPVQELP